MKKRSPLKKVIVIFFILFCMFFIATEAGIMKYLKEYGYGIKELPQTTMVYFHLSKGFTVEEIDGVSTFIGRHDYIYDRVFEKKGYYETDRLGSAGYYKKGEDKKGEHNFDFSIYSTDNWCHWFRVYQMNKDYTIEDF